MCLSPIYDALDALNPTLALTLLPPALHKTQNLTEPASTHQKQVLLALGTLAAVNTHNYILAGKYGRELGFLIQQETREILSTQGRKEIEKMEEKEECPITGKLDVKHVDTIIGMGQGVMEPIVLAWKGWGKAKNVAILYEHIATESPTHENLSAAFFAHLKAKDVHAMQALGLKAFRLSKNATWIMFSVVSKVLSGGELDLKVAYGMYSKIEANSKEDIELEIHILDAQKKYEQILALLETPLVTQVLMKSDLLRRKVQYLTVLDKREQALSACKEWIIEQPDQWCAYMAFLELEKGPAASDFFNNVTGASERTRMMLDLELKHTFGEPPQLDKYLETFGAKRCCYTDLEKYLLAGSWDQTKQVPDTHLATYAKCWRKQKTQNHVQQSTRLYLETYFTNPERTDLVLTAVHRILETANSSLSSILQAIHVIECANTPTFEPELQLILLRLFLCVGSATNASKIWRKLAIKHIQWDSLSWLIDSYLPALSDHTLANEDFYEDAEREIPDCMITAFRSGTWSQISRFADLRNAIANSFTRRVQNVCNGYMRADEDQPSYNSDNRDLNALDEDLLRLTSPQSIPDVTWVETWVRRYDCYNGKTDFEATIVANDMYIKPILTGELSPVIEKSLDKINKTEWCNYQVMEKLWRLIELIQVYKRRWPRDQRRSEAAERVLAVVKECKSRLPYPGERPEWLEGLECPSSIEQLWQPDNLPQWLQTVHEDIKERLKYFRDCLEDINFVFVGGVP